MIAQPRAPYGDTEVMTTVAAGEAAAVPLAGWTAALGVSGSGAPATVMVAEYIVVPGPVSPGATLVGA